MVIVDTMLAKHFDKKRIPGVVNSELPVKMNDVTPEEMEVFLKALGTDKNKTIIVYCGFVGYARSDVGARLALEAGYKNVYRVLGGTFYRLMPDIL